SPVAYLRPAFAVSQETQKGLLRNVLRIVMVPQHRVRNSVNEPGLFPNCGLELVPAGIGCRNGLAQNHLPGIDHRGPHMERRHYPLKRSDKFDCRLLMADCRLKKRCAELRCCQSAIGNRKSTIPAILGKAMIAETLRKRRRSLELVL